MKIFVLILIVISSLFFRFSVASAQMYEQMLGEYTNFSSFGMFGGQASWLIEKNSSLEMSFDIHAYKFLENSETAFGAEIIIGSIAQTSMLYLGASSIHFFSENAPESGLFIQGSTGIDIRGSEQTTGFVLTSGNRLHLWFGMNVSVGYSFRISKKFAPLQIALTQGAYLESRTYLPLGVRLTYLL